MHLYLSHKIIAIAGSTQKTVLIGALEGDPQFWIIGIAGAVTIHFIVFNILDIFHDHHSHKNRKIPIFIAQVLSMDCRDGKHFSCTHGRGCMCVCHKRDA